MQRGHGIPIVCGALALAGVGCALSAPTYSNPGSAGGADALPSPVSVPCPADPPAHDYQNPAGGVFSGSDLKGYVCTGGAVAFMERTQASSYVGSQLLVLIETTGASSNGLQFTMPSDATDGNLIVMAGVGAAAPGVYRSADGTSCGSLAFCLDLPLPPSVKCPDATGACPSPDCAMQGPLLGPTCMPVPHEVCYLAKAAASCLPAVQTPTGGWTLHLTSVTPYATDADTGGMSFYAIHGSFAATMVEDQATAGAAAVTADLAISF